MGWLPFQFHKKAEDEPIEPLSPDGIEQLIRDFFFPLPSTLPPWRRDSHWPAGSCVVMNAAMELVLQNEFHRTPMAMSLVKTEPDSSSDDVTASGLGTHGKPRIVPITKEVTSTKPFVVSFFAPDQIWLKEPGDTESVIGAAMYVAEESDERVMVYVSFGRYTNLDESEITLRWHRAGVLTASLA